MAAAKRTTPPTVLPPEPVVEPITEQDTACITVLSVDDTQAFFAGFATGWEYAHIKGFDSDWMLAHLNAAGQDGWEVISVDSYHGIAWLKRQIAVTSPAEEATTDTIVAEA